MSEKALALPPAQVMPAPKTIDDESLAMALRGFDALMQHALRVTTANRYLVIGKLAAQAHSLLSMAAPPRVGDYDNRQEINLLGDYGDNMMGAAMPRGAIHYAGGDQAEVVRQMIDAITSMQDRPKKVAPIDELNTLLMIRQSLVDQQLGTADVDGKIEKLRKEVTNGTTGDGVVSPQLLRGHQAQAGVGHGDDRVLGEADPDGEEGAGGVDP